MGAPLLAFSKLSTCKTQNYLDPFHFNTLATFMSVLVLPKFFSTNLSYICTLLFFLDFYKKAFVLFIAQIVLPAYYVLAPTMACGCPDQWLRA